MMEVHCGILSEVLRDCISEVLRGEIFPVLARRQFRGVELWPHSFLTSALHGIELSTSHPSRFTAGKECWCPLALLGFEHWIISISTTLSRLLDRICGFKIGFSISRKCSIVIVTDFRLRQRAKVLGRLEVACQGKSGCCV